MKIEASGYSDKGLVRAVNQDVFLVEKGKSNPSIYAVCDGMGGLYGGDIAAKRAVKILKQYAGVLKRLKNKRETLLTALEQLIEKMDRSIIEMSGKKKKRMGTTLALLYIDKEYSIAVNVGDSRIYRLQENSWECLSKDDNLLDELLRKGLVEKNAVQAHQGKYQLTQFLGMGGEKVKIVPHIHILEKPKENDIYLLCSDGLNPVLEKEVFEEIKKEEPASYIAREMVTMAKQIDGSDNITAVIAKIKKI